jgi:hypothetical protein
MGVYLATSHYVCARQLGPFGPTTFWCSLGLFCALSQISQFDIVSNTISHPNNVNLHVIANDKRQCLGIVGRQTRPSGDVLSLNSV